MGAGASAQHPYPNAEAALADGKTQAEIDAFAENYPRCERLISLKAALPIYVAIFGYDPISPVVSLAAFQRIHGVGNAL